jgi:SAM-dependent methyltransferase
LRGRWRRRRAMNRPLGDSTAADYSDKLESFARFAAAEVADLVALLPLAPGSRVLDAGCGTGHTLPLFRQRVGPAGLVVGLDLAGAHLSMARERWTALVQADFAQLPFRASAFDTAWMVNALNHAADPPSILQALRQVVRPGGSVAVAQSALTPDMMFAWDLRLERVVREACLRAYRDAYGLRETDTAGVRRLVGLFREAGLLHVSATTAVIERVSPLDVEAERHIRETILEGYWGAKLEAYLSPTDWKTLSSLCDPSSPAYALRRRDFHHLQTLTMVQGRVPPAASV